MLCEKGSGKQRGPRATTHSSPAGGKRQTACGAGKCRRCGGPTGRGACCSPACTSTRQPHSGPGRLGRGRRLDGTFMSAISKKKITGVPIIPVMAQPIVSLSANMRVTVSATRSFCGTFLFWITTAQSLPRMAKAVVSPTAALKAYSVRAHPCRLLRQQEESRSQPPQQRTPTDLVEPPLGRKDGDVPVKAAAGRHAAARRGWFCANWTANKPFQER